MVGLRSGRALIFEAALFCCIGSVGLTCAHSAPYPENESDIVRGTVLNSVTRRPLGRALVYSPDNRFATLTDSDGHFEFKIPLRKPQQKNEGTLPLAGSILASPPEEAIRPAFLMARKPGFISDENTRGAQVGPEQKEVTIYLTPAALIAGHVTLGASEMPDRVRLSIYRRQIQEGRARWTPAGTFRTWANGEFRFPELPPGTYKLFTEELMDRDPLTFDPRGQSYGYPPVYFPAANDFASGSAIQLSPGATFDATLSPTRREYYRIEVGITNAPEGAPVNVVVSAAGQGGPGYSLGINPQAQKIQGMLPDGMYSRGAIGCMPIQLGAMWPRLKAVRRTCCIVHSSFRRAVQLSRSR